ncbi:hypothetical protein LGK95_18580 [Clostridium algoriphilum]|uniref:hypothetical protein n=1 Tax=Clostridium algoriphilum TaxID=198347 RepID=UPI001CF4E152|nr:hypothetical protein [Clostridium algoriphilum]MCB2295492.1 hypothetical protein [Clostridium algoriphilum]
MSYLILVSSLLTVLLMIFSKNVFYSYYKEIDFKIKQRLDVMLKLAIIAPIIVLIVIVILNITYFKTKFNIRVSHEWLLLSFWVCCVIFYYISAEISRIKSLMIILPAIGMLISMGVAVYLTPLHIYENIFKDTNLIIPNSYGVIMIIVAYYTNYALLKKGAKN